MDIPAALSILNLHAHLFETHQLYHIDALTLLNSLAAESVDVIVTSPPYNIGVDYGVYQDLLPPHEYMRWSGEWLRAASRALKPHGSLFLNIGSKPTQPYTPFDLLERARPYFRLQNTIHWVKSIAIGERTHGHYKPINSARFINDCHEYIFHLTSSGFALLDRTAIGVPYTDDGNSTRWLNTDKGHCRGNTWFIPYKTIQYGEQDRPHPATFPETLPEWCMKLHGIRSDMIVVDPFMGSGSTAVACRNVWNKIDGQVKFIGCDINLEYVKYAEARLLRV